MSSSAKSIFLAILCCAGAAAAQVEFQQIVPTPGMPMIGFAAPTMTVYSFTSPVSVTVFLSQPTSVDVTVNYIATGKGQSVVGYQLADDTLTISAGQTSGVIQFQVMDRNDVEGDETVQVILSNPQGATLGQNVLNVVIKNDNRDPDTAPALPVVNMVAAADRRSVSLELTTAYPDQASVDYQITLSQTGSQLSTILSTGTAIFQSDETQVTIHIPQPTDDIDVSGVKTISIFLNNPVNVMINNPLIALSY